MKNATRVKLNLVIIKQLLHKDRSEVVRVLDGLFAEVREEHDSREDLGRRLTEIIDSDFKTYSETDLLKDNVEYWCSLSDTLIEGKQTPPPTDKDRLVFEEGVVELVFDKYIKGQCTYFEFGEMAERADFSRLWVDGYKSDVCRAIYSIYMAVPKDERGKDKPKPRKEWYTKALESIGATAHTVSNRAKNYLKI